MDVTRLPTLNALLNATSAVLLIAGYLCIRRRKVTVHKICMLSAFVTSCLFLISYLILRYYAGMTRFTGQGWIRPVYFTILMRFVVLIPTIILFTMVNT